MGQTLVLLHGLASNGSRWAEYARTSRVAGDWRILTPDLRGMGSAVYRGRIDSDLWVADLVALLDREGVERCVIGGHCLGANVAARFALAHPGRVDALVLVEPFLPGAVSGRIGRLVRLRWMLKPVAWVARMLNAVGLYRRTLPSLDLEALDLLTRQHLAGGADRSVLLKRYGSIRYDLRYVPVSVYFQALYETLKPAPDWSRIRAPTLVLLSDGSQLGMADAAERALASIPQQEIKRCPSDHWIHAEAPAELREAIDHYLTVTIAAAGSPHTRKTTLE